MTTREPRPDGSSRMRPSVRHGIAGALTGIALLTAFHQVVRAGVQQGETRRKAVAVRADAEWRCKSLRAPRAVDCLLRLDSVRDDAPFV